MSAENPIVCPTCGTPLETAASVDFCPRCLWNEFAGAELESPAKGATDSLFEVPGHDVIAEIARGGGGIVYRARQHEPTRLVALKMLLPHQVTSDELLTRFRVEAETVAALNHPAILPVYTVGEHRGMPYFTMKLAVGGTLASRTRELIGDWRSIAQLLVKLADALQFAHLHGVIHRDLKPANVLFDEGDRPYLSDFGLAKFVNVDSKMTRSIAMFGTPAYLAPELVTGGMASATTASDIYGLGSVLYELLTGKPPFVAPSLPMLLKKVADEDPTAPRRIKPRMPKDLEVICMRALAKDPRSRFSSASDLAADLKRWLEGHPIESRPSNTAERLWRWARRHPVPATLTSMLAAVLVTSGILLVQSNGRAQAALASEQATRTAAQKQLREALISEGRLKRQSGLAGQRHEALNVLERAAELGPSLELRNEVAAALARPDVRWLHTTPAYLSQFYSMIDFAPETGTYLTPLEVAPNRWDIELRSLHNGEVLRTFGSHDAMPAVLRFSGDGKRFVARHVDMTREYWSIDGDEPLFRDGPWSQLEWVGDTLHPTLPRAAIHTGRSDIHLRDLTTGEQRFLYRSPDEVMKIAYSPDGSRLAVVSHNSFEVIDAGTGEPIWSKTGQMNGVDPAWSPDGNRVVWSGSRHQLTNFVAEADTGTRVAELQGHREIPSWFEFSGDGTQLFAMTRDHLVRMWEIARSQLLLTLEVPASGFAVSIDGTRLAVPEKPGSVVLYDIAPSGVIEPLRAAHPPPRVRVGLELQTAPSQPLALTACSVLDFSTATGGGSSLQIMLWDSELRREAGRFSCPLIASVYGNEPATAMFALDGSSVFYGSLSAGTRRRTLSRDAGGRLEISEEESIAAAGPGVLLKEIDGHGNWYLHDFKLGQVVVWPAGDPARSHTLFKTPVRDLTVAATPDGRWAAMVSNTLDNVIRVYDTTAPGDEPRRVTADGLRYLDFSAGGKWMLATNPTDVMSWRMPDLEPGPTWTTVSDGDTRRAFAFSPDGRWLASAAARNRVDVRDARTLEPLVQLEAPVEFQRCAWSLDGNELYLLDAADNEIQLARWNLTKLRQELASRGLDW